MKNVLLCRRTFIATMSILSLLIMALVKNMDTSWSIAAVTMGLAGSNAAEAVMKVKAAITPAK